MVNVVKKNDLITDLMYEEIMSLRQSKREHALDTTQDEVEKLKKETKDLIVSFGKLYNALKSESEVFSDANKKLYDDMGAKINSLIKTVEE